LLKDGFISFSGLITHEFTFLQSPQVFSDIKDSKEDFLGVVLKYDQDNSGSIRKIDLENQKHLQSDQVNIGVIGAGNYASTMLIPFLKENSNSNLVGIATATGINAKDKARKFGFNYATTDYNDVINDPAINSVLIATRHNQHAKMVMDAFASGKHVYVEKPLAITIDELKAIFQLNSGKDQLLMVGYNRRFASSINFLKSQLKKNIPYSVYYQVNAGYMPKEAWYQSEEQGGRVIGEVCHFIDTLQYLLDAEPVEVFMSSTLVSDMPEQDNSFITIRFSNNSTGVIAYLADGDKKYPKEKISVTGYRTNIEFDNFKSVTVYKDGKITKKKFFIIDKGQKKEMSEFVNAVKTGKAPISFNSLILTTYSSIMAIESLRSKKSYKISIDNLNG
jgi:polar amino acid transport system substrate-binding protein